MQWRVNTARIIRSRSVVARYTGAGFALAFAASFVLLARAAAQVHFQVDAVVPLALPQSDGRIIVPSESVRLNSDGSIDRTFNASFTGRMQTAAVQADNKVLIAHSDGIDDFYQRPPLLQRFNIDGSLDRGFNAVLPEVQVIVGLAVQDDGRILVGGYAGVPVGQVDPSFPAPRLRLLRLNSDGSRDSAFVKSEVRSAGARPAFGLQPGGKIILPMGDAPYLLRLNADGSIDNTFQPPSGYVVLNFVIDPTGAVVIGGAFPDDGGIPSPGLARLLPNGILDDRFHPPTAYVFDRSPLGIQTNGNVLASVYNRPTRAYILLRLLADGSIDPSYNASIPENVNSIKPEPDGKVVIAGDFQNVGGLPRTGTARLNLDGTVDQAFYPIFTRPGQVFTLAAQGDKVIAGGGFTRVDGPFVGSVVRLNRDGSLDDSYHLRAISGNTLHAAVQSDGKILLSNDIVPVGQSYYTSLTRLNADGTFDPSFRSSNTTVFRTFALQSTGKILGVLDDAIFRLNSDGTSDPSFITNQSRSTIYGLTVQADDHFFIFGRGRLGLLDRLNTDGSFDPTFKDPQANKDIDAVAVQADGKVVVGGSFQFFGDSSNYFSELTPRPYLARLQPDGRIDDAFKVAVNSTVSAICVQKNGQIVIGGAFTSVNNYPVGGIARLNPDGSFDSSFLISTQGGAVSSIVELSSGTVAVGGAFGVVTSVVSPLPSQIVSSGTNVPFTTLVISPPQTTIAEVRFLLNGNVIAIAKDPLAFHFGQPKLRENVRAVAGGNIVPNAAVYGTLLQLPGSGMFSLSVQVVDSAGNISTSSESSVTAVDSAQLPPPTTFEISSVLTGTVLLSGHPISVSARPSNAVGSTLSKVALYVNGLKVQELNAVTAAGNAKAATGSYLFNFTPPAPGSYALVVVATATNGSTTSSPVVAVTAAPPSVLANISTRMFVDTGDNVLIGGLIIVGAAEKKIIVRAIGPSLASAGVTGALQNPTLELRDKNGTLLATNDDWGSNANKQEIIDSTVAPGDPRESALLLKLQLGNYTAVVRGVDSSTGVALVEAYDLESDIASTKLGNISTRGQVLTDNKAMIGGFIIVPNGNAPKKVIIRAVGPSLTGAGIAGALQNPTLELHDSTGALIARNDDWKVTLLGGVITADQQADIAATGIPPNNEAESAIVANLNPGSYTAIVRGKGDATGVGLVEVYDLDK